MLVDTKKRGRGHVSKKDVAIFGSCVTRDTFAVFPPKDATLRLYVARQSWVSIDRSASNLAKGVDLGSSFANRNFRGDLVGDAWRRISQLARATPNLHLLIDLADERGGLLVGPQGQVVTKSFEASRQGALEPPPDDWEHVKLGSIGHATLFAEAAEILRARLEKIGLLSRTAIVKSSWALADTWGTPTPPSFGLSAQEANAAYAALYDYLANTGWTVLDEPSQAPIADPGHRWGLAAFHYTEPYYQELSNIITEFLDQ